MTTIGRVIDLSSNNHPNGAAIKWQAVKDAGVTTAIVKATQDVGYTNPYFVGDVAGARAVGIDTLGYHFAGMSPPRAQAQHFRSVAGTLARILDIETQRNVPFCRDFLAELGWAHDQCMTYGSASSLVDIYRQLPSMAWPAAYGQLYPGWGALWQFTDKATIPGINGLVDENRWYGSEIQYETLFGLLDPPAPIPVPEGAVEMDSVVATNGDIVSHYRTPQNHLLEVTRKAGDQGEPPDNAHGLSIVDITAAYPQFQVVS